MPTPQSASNHTAFDVVTHFILGPIFLLTIAVAIIAAFHAHGPLMIALHLWLVVVALAFLLLNVKTRLYSLALQDRLIRLEERQRLAALLPAAEAAVAIQSLSMRQLIALRFASDAELPALVRATLAEVLSRSRSRRASRRGVRTWYAFRDTRSLASAAERKARSFKTSVRGRLSGPVASVYRFGTVVRP